MRILARVVATLGLVALVTALLVWWTDRADHSEGDAEVLATGLEVPWGLTFLPTGDALVGERNTGRIYRIPADGGERTLVGTVPGVVPDGEGGLLGLAVDPLFIHDSFVYAYLTAEADNRIIRFRLTPDEPEVYDVEVVLDGIAKAGNHDGGALAFGPDGMLYAGVGDAGDPCTGAGPRLPQRQDPADGPARRTRRSRTPTPTPTRSSGRWGTATCRAWPGTRAAGLWATEFGQDTFDEVNLIEPGGNYGWPEVEGVGDDDRFIDPAGHLVHRRGQPVGARDRRRHAVRRRPARPAPLDDPAVRRRAGRPGGSARRTVRPAAQRPGRARRLAVDHHQQPRRPRRPRR